MGQPRVQREWAWAPGRTGAWLEPQLCLSRAAWRPLGPSFLFREVGLTVLALPTSWNEAQRGCRVNALCQLKVPTYTQKRPQCQN